MRKPAISDIKSWHVAVAAQYLVGGVGFMILVYVHRLSRGPELVPLILVGLVFALFSLVAVLSAIANKRVLGFLLAVAALYLVGHFFDLI